MSEERLSTCRGTGSALQKGFYREAVSKAILYRRAAGFFSSTVFLAAFDEVKLFFARGGSMEVVCNHRLRLADCEALCDGLYRPGKWLEKPVEAIPWSRAADLLAWAVANGRLHVKVALVAPPAKGIYHEKFGIFLSEHGADLAFEGSANETLGGICINYERVSLYAPRSPLLTVKCRELLAEFEDLWHNRTMGLTVLPFHKALRSGAIELDEDAGDDEIARKGRPVSAMAPEAELLRLPPRLLMREYQLRAVRSWFEAEGRGILEMATGSGKTFTALFALTKLYERIGGPMAVLILAPYIHLVDQWAEHAESFGLSPIRCYGAKEHWRRFLSAAILRLNNGDRSLLSIVVTNATFSSADFQNAIRKLAVRTVLVADEVHNLGAPRLAKSLPDRVELRLGLSATPGRWLDETGTDRLTAYFGPVVYRFGLKEAIEHIPPVLVPYRYFPVVVELEDDEQEQYLELTAAIARSITDLDASTLSDLAIALLIKRSRLLASARGKLPALRNAIRPFRELPFSLVYCGDSTVEFGDDGGNADEYPEQRRQIDAVTMMLGHELGMQVAQFTAQTAREDRQVILQRFGAGDLQALVAIRCLDEGVDIPHISRAFILASSTNPRQFIQRRGRILRKAPGKSVAEIFDFIVRPPSIGMLDSAARPAGKRLIQNELRRVAEFCGLAQNGPEARLVLQPMLKEWDLLHL